MNKVFIEQEDLEDMEIFTEENNPMLNSLNFCMQGARKKIEDKLEERRLQKELEDFD